MIEETVKIIDKLCDVVGNMQKCLECKICLLIISDPVKTRCIHRFCRPCIEKVLQQRKPSCPVCYKALHPRSITKDEHMVLCIDRFEKLIQAVELDTGIDVLAQLSRPRSGPEGGHENPAECSKSNCKESIKPDCSYDSTSLPMNSAASRSNQTARGKRKAPKRQSGKRKYPQKPESSIAKYLSKCAMSGVELLPPDEPDCRNEKSLEEKVYNWLDNLPGIEVLDDPNKISQGETAECDLDDTLLVSVSQNENRNETKTPDKSTEAIAKETNHVEKRRAVTKQSSWDSIFQENEATEIKGKRTNTNKTNTDVNRDNQNPNTSKGIRSRDVSGERSLEASIDIHKTSPCDLLPTMKENWTSVKGFGKEMHLKRKKLKSLNVSIEHKNKSERKVETEININVTDIDSLPAKDTSRRQVGKKAKTSVRTRKSSIRQCNEKKRRSMDAENEPEKAFLKLDTNGCARSNEVEVTESAFITLNGDEQVKIRSLNSYQLNDIIGIAGDAERQDIEKNTHEEPRNSKIEQNDPSTTSLQDRSKNISRETPLKQPTSYEQESPINKRCKMQNNFSPSMLPANENSEEEMSEITSKTILRAPNSNRKRLSLRKSDTGQKSNNSIFSYSDSRLETVKRDLKYDIDDTLNADPKSKTKQTIPSEMSKQDVTQVRRSAGAWHECGKRKKDNRKSNESTVVFKQLGKTFKHRRKNVNFLYLGTNRRESLLDCNFPRPGVLKPCNPIDVSDRENPAVGFGNNAYFTVNYTPAVEMSGSGDVVKTELETSKCVPEIMASRDSPLKTVPQSTSKNLAEMANNSKTKTQSSDTLRVSLDKKVETFRSPIDRPAKSSKKFTINPVKLLSPTKDSQLQFLSLSSPEVENIRPRELAETPEAVKDIDSPSEIKGAHSKALINTLQEDPHGLDQSSTPRKKKVSRIRESLSLRMKRKEDERNADYCPSNRSFSSAVGYIDNLENEAPPIKRNNAIERCQAWRANEIDVVSLSSDGDSTQDRMERQKKVYKRIVPLGSSDGSQGSVACVNKTANDQPVASQASKRKRESSPDSDVETDLNMIANSWYEEAKYGERSRKRGKLDESRNLPNSINATRNNPSSRSASNDRNRSIARNSSMDKFQHVGTNRGQRLEESVTLVVEDDSPNFSEMIEKVKDIRNGRSASDEKGRESKEVYLMQDNFDEVMANVNTEILLDDYNDAKECEVEEVIVRGSQRGWLNKNTSVNARRSGKMSLLANCSSFDKNNINKESASLFDDTDKSFSSEYLSATKRGFEKNKSKAKMETRPTTNTSESARVRPNNSMGDKFVLSNDENKFPSNNTMGKDTFDQDSLLNITQHYLMIKQIEEDLFGKPNCSKAGSAMERTNQDLRTPKTNRKQVSKVKRKDVEHLAEEDDIVENTPDTKKKKICNQTVVSPKAKSDASSTSSPMFSVHSPMKSTWFTASKDDVNSPAFQKQMAAFHHSTPKVQQPVPKPNYSSAKTISSISDGNQTKSDTEKNMESVQKFNRQRFCFACSGLIPSQIEQVKILAGFIKARYLTQFHPDVTHVIVKTEQNNRANKTLKYLQGIAHRKWIVSYQWVLDSLKERRLINEEPYEAVDIRTLEAGPRKSRLRDKALFQDFAFLCVGPYSDVTVAQYQDLLRATGGTVVDTLISLVGVQKKLKIIVVQVDIHSNDIIGWYKQTHAVPVVHDWVVECISQYKLISLYPYIQELSRQEVLALGYPDFLVEDEPDGDSDNSSDE